MAFGDVGLTIRSYFDDTLTYHMRKIGQASTSTAEAVFSVSELSLVMVLEVDENIGLKCHLPDCFTKHLTC